MDTINKLLLAFITLIIGLVLLGSVATSVGSVNSLTTVTNETQSIAGAISEGIVNTSYGFTVTNAPTDWKTIDCPLTSVAIVNATNADVADYTFYANNGTWYLSGTTVNTSKFWDNNNSYVTYTYCGDNYLNLGWGRSVLGVAVGMFALAILFVSLAMFYSLAKDAGLIE